MTMVLLSNLSETGQWLTIDKRRYIKIVSVQKKSTLSGYLEILKKKTRDAPKEMISDIMRCYSIQL